MVAKKIAVIGAGNMGTALLRGILASGWGTKENLIASHPKRREGRGAGVGARHRRHRRATTRPRGRRKSSSSP